MKQRAYRILVARVPGIRERYVEFRERSGRRWAALLYLLWLNIQYYFFFRRSLRESRQFPVYEEKILHCSGSESSLSRRESPEAFAEELSAADVISVDVFDTLLFRPFSNPTDLFLLVGTELQYPDFKRIRVEIEQYVRRKKHVEKGTWEVTLEEIWEAMEIETGIPQNFGMRVEWEWERRCCYANPYMLNVVRELEKRGKRLIAVSDMYAGGERIAELLKKCGYGGFEGCFVSSDYSVSKADGGLLYDVMRSKTGERARYIHVGDSPASDYRQASRHGVRAYLYPNIHRAGARFRPQDLSSLIGSVYRGLVNAHLHNGLKNFSREYEYGYLYGGLFVAGYCRFIHEFARQHGIEKLLFLSRDGAVLLKAYRQMYPKEAGKTEYVYWSRLASVKLTARYYRHEYFRRFLYHKVDRGYSIRQILQGMELEKLLLSLCEKIQQEPEEKLTYKNVEKIKKYLIDAWEQVLASYEKQVEAGGIYYGGILKGCQSAAAVDIGWAGSGAVMLDAAVNRLWGIGCSITGIIAGTNSCLSREMDTAEPFLLRGKMTSYLYSQRENRDLWKFHDPAAGHNLYWELLLGAPEGSFIGFYPDENGNVTCRFKETPPGADSIREIHRGVLDFVGQLLETERQIGWELPISGRDAYAPMLLACSRKNKKFMKGLEELLDEEHIG